MSALLLLFLSSLLVLVRSQTAPYVTFMGQTYSSYSCIDLLLVGEEENDGVHCNTDLHSCCTLDQGYDSGDWYPPGSISSLPFYSEAVYIYQERESRRVSLYRRDLDSAGEAGEGVYECDIETVATNMNGGSDRATAYVELKTGGCAVTVDPKIVLAEDSNFFDEPQWFKLTCVSTGLPGVAWTRDSVFVSGGQTTTVSTVGLTIQFIHTLTVVGRLGGLYACTASGGSPPTNTAGYYIQVASAPTDLKAEQVGLTEVRLSWTPPSPLGDTLDYIVSYSYHKSQFSEDIEEYAGGDGSTDKFIVMGFDVGRSYNLTVMGASQHFPSDPVTTTIYIAPVGTAELFRAVAGQRKVTFSWSPPTVTAPISNYTLSCTPSLSSLPHTFTTAGSHTVTGFAPDTEYLCAVVANYNTTVSGSSATLHFTTEEDHHGFQLILAGYIDCNPWLLSYYEYKLSVMQEVIADEIAELCNCDFTFSNVDQDKLECISGSTNSLNYTGRLTSKTDQDSASLVASLEGWASEEPTVSVEGVLLRVTADECTGILTDVNSDVCPNRRSGSGGSGESKTAVETGAPIAAAIVFAAIVAGVIVIILYLVIRNRRMGQRRDGLDQQPQLISDSRGQPPHMPLTNQED